MNYLPEFSSQVEKNLALPSFVSQGEDNSIQDSSDYIFSVGDSSSIHTSDYGTSSADEDESEEDLKEMDQSLAKVSPKESSPLGKSSLDSHGASSDDWADVTDSSSDADRDMSTADSVAAIRPLKLSTVARPGERTSKAITIPEIYEGKGRIRMLQSTSQSRLQNVEYISKVDLASSNRGISTVGPITKVSAHEAFEQEVPHEVPTESYEDEVSSIGAVSQPDQKQNRRLSHTPYDLEKGIREAQVRHTLQAALQEEVKGSWISNRRNELELFFIALISIALVTLVVLLILMLTQK